MIKIFVLSEWMAKGIGVFGDNTLVISITSPGSEHPKLIGENIFKFHFHDIDKELLVKNRVYRPMERELAESIVDIALDHRDKKVWVIHCEAGISRSPGVALGLASRIETFPDVQKLEQSFPCHNRHVRRLIEESLDKAISERFMKNVKPLGTNINEKL